MIEKLIDHGMDLFANEKTHPEEWDLDGLIEYAEDLFAAEGDLKKSELESMSREEVREDLLEAANENYDRREVLFGVENMRELEKVVMLKVVDAKWMDHLDAMDMLRQGIGLRAYGQKDPLIEYKIEAFDMFGQMIEHIQEDIVRYIYRVNIVTQAEDRLAQATTSHGDEAAPNEPIRAKETVGRNELCPCGSGKKYKKCCGAK